MIGRIGAGIRIELLPAFIAPSGIAISNIHRRAIKNRLVLRLVRIWNARSNKRSTTANAFGIRARVFLASSGLSQCTYNAACGAARHSSGRG